MDYKSSTVHDLPASERPRERLAKLGAENVSQEELLAIVLGRGIKGESVLGTARKLIDRFHTLQGLADATIEELCTVKGIKLAKAAQIKAALEMGKRLRYHSEEEQKKPVKRPIKSPEDVINEVKKDLAGKKKEHFLVVHLDTRNRPIGDPTEVSVGNLNSSTVHPREAFQDALKASAASVIFVHNHPSGDPQPSDDDIDITRRLVEAGKILGIEVLDHVIVAGSSSPVSLKAKKLM